MHLTSIRIIIIILTVCLLIVIDPSKWTSGVFALLKERKNESVITVVGVIDRIESNQAVILIESEREELLVHTKHLPEDCYEGMWVIVNKYFNGTYQIKPQHDLTEKYNKKSKTLFNRLY